MSKLVNRAKMTTATTGTGTLTLGSAVAGYQTFANAGVANSNIVRYTIEDGSAWEIGLGTYSSTGTTLTRGTIESSTGTAINLSGNATVFVTAAAGDLQELVDFADNFVLPTADGSTGQVLTTNGAGTLSFTTIAGYTNADVDAHLNTGTAASGEVLSWNGSDYDWVTVAAGATNINGLSDGYSDGSSVGLGTNALANDDGTANENVAVGINAGDSITSGYRNVIIGSNADGNATGTYDSVIIGREASALSRESVAIGSSAKAAVFSTSIGYGAHATNGGGNSSVAIGRDAGRSVSGFGNLSVSNNAGRNITTGTHNQALGYNALYGSSVSNLTGSHNTGIGYQTGYYLSTGANNFLGGYQAGTNLTTGSNNVAIGNGALDAATTGGRNIAIGQDAMGLGVATAATGDNIAIGYQAGYDLTSGERNQLIGPYAGWNITSGVQNVSIGYESLRFATTAQGNSAVGYTALEFATGGFNTALGYSAGNTLTTGTNNTLLGNDAEPSSATVSNEITLGNSSITTMRCQVTTITSLSDARDKTDIQPLNAGLEFVEALNPVSFTWNMRDGGKVGEADTGFIAQDLQSAQADTGVTIPGLVYDVNPDKLEAGYGKLIPVLVQAIKDLSAKVNILEAQLEAK